MKNYTNDHSLNHDKLLKYPWTQKHFLGDYAIVFPFHVVDDFIPEKYIVWKIFFGIYFHILMQYEPIIGRISAWLSWYLNRNGHFPGHAGGGMVFVNTDFFFKWAIM